MPLKKLDKFMAFAPPLMGEEEVAEVADTLRSGWLTTGPKTERFEKALAEYLSAPRGVAVSSCTAALHLGLKILGVGPDQGVILPPLTFASTAHAVMYMGARPFFVDIDPQTGNIDPALIRTFLEEECSRQADGTLRHRDGSIISTLLPVHYGGHPADLDGLWALAGDYGLNMLEDAAHALGSLYRGRAIGDPGLKPQSAAGLTGLTAFSFYATKNLATGEGGYLVADKEDLIERARVLSMYGISDSRKIWGRYAPKGTWVYDVADLGFKYNMMDIQAAIGLHQLSKLTGFIQKRALNASIYNEVFSQIPDLVRLPRLKPGVGPAWHLYPLRINPWALKIGRDELIEELRSRNIGTSVLFIPLHYHSYYRRVLPYAEGDFPQSEAFFKDLINLPISPAHSSQTVETAAEIIADVLRRHLR